MVQGINEASGDVTLGGPAPRWRRLVAFVVDALLLGAPALAVGFLLFEAASALGEWGRLVGLALAATYFAVFDSRLGGGQSPGKRLLGVKVTRWDGTLLSPGTAAVRALILLIPFYLNGLQVDEGTSAVLLSLLTLLVFGLGLSIVYLFLFNSSRRSLHDLATGAVVVDAQTIQPPRLLALWPGHWIAVGAVCSLAIAAPLIDKLGGEPSGELKELRDMSRSIMTLPEVKTAYVGRQWGTMTSLNGGTQRWEAVIIVASVRTPSASSDDDRIAKQIKDAMFTKHSDAIGEKRVAITLRRSFTFGLAHGNKDVSVTTSLAEWRTEPK